jgi:hypothetical protein
MDYKNTMQGILIGTGLLVSTAQAECFIRSAMTSETLTQIERITDIEKQIIPIGNNQQKCRVFFRAYIEDQWHGAEAEEVGSVGDSLDQLCAKAMSAGQIDILESVAGIKVNSSQEMICTDEARPNSKPSVKIGDLVMDSEVQIHPVYRDQFSYRGSICRWFIESRPQVRQIEMQQGVICRSPGEKIWKVVDKW